MHNCDVAEKRIEQLTQDNHDMARWHEARLQELHRALERNAQLQGRNTALVEDLHATQRLLALAEQRLRERSAA